MKVLVLKTSSDVTMQRLFKKLDKAGNNDIDCLIQSSQFEKYKKEYPNVRFIDICRERFEDLPTEVIDMVLQKKYDQLYITLSGVHGHNFWNVVKLVSTMRFKKAFFYNCNGDKIKIPGKNMMKDTLCRFYIKYIGYVYR